MEKEDKGKTVQRCKGKREKEGKNITAKGEKTEYCWRRKERMRLRTQRKRR